MIPPTARMIGVDPARTPRASTSRASGVVLVTPEMLGQETRTMPAEAERL